MADCIGATIDHTSLIVSGLWSMVESLARLDGHTATARRRGQLTNVTSEHVRDRGHVHGPARLARHRDLGGCPRPCARWRPGEL